MRTHQWKPIIILPILAVFYASSDKSHVTCYNTKNNQNGSDEISPWYQVGEMTGVFLKNCLDSAAIPETGQEFMDMFQNCLRRRSLQLLDSSLSNDVISISGGIELVRYKDANMSSSNRLHNMRSTKTFIGDQMEWNEEVFYKIIDLFDTHELKIALSEAEREKASRQPRGRRKKDNMMVSLLVFAIITVGLIVIPMGFQFLAVLGGKALLLAKLALILSSIQGLKKIATSSFNYGLYSAHSGPPNPWDGDERWNYPYVPSGGGQDVYGQADPYYDPHQSHYPDPHQMMYRKQFINKANKDG